MRGGSFLCIFFHARFAANGHTNRAFGSGGKTNLRLLQVGLLSLKLGLQLQLCQGLQVVTPLTFAHEPKYTCSASLQQHVN